MSAERPRCCPGVTRRSFLADTGLGFTGLALGALLFKDGVARAAERPDGKPHFPPKAKHVIYLHMVGGPPQMDLYDYKPKMNEMFDKDLPDSIRMGQRLTGMTSGQARFPVAPSKFKFEQYGESGMWVSELLPWTAKMVDEMCFIRSMHTEAINHEPAITFMQTGNQVTGRPCLGAWTSYGLGSLNQNLPAFVAFTSGTSTSRRTVPAVCAARSSSPSSPRKASSASGTASLMSIPTPASASARPRSVAPHCSTIDRRNVNSTSPGFPVASWARPSSTMWLMRSSMTARKRSSLVGKCR